MCLAIPGKIIKIKGERALVEFGKLKKEINIMLTPQVKVGDIVIVHAGFAIQKVLENEFEFMEE